MPTDIDSDRGGILLLDSSTAIALLLKDHDQHRAVMDAVRGRNLGLAGHAWFETYSVLTRLPAGRRRSPGDTVKLLAHNFPESRFLGPAESADLGQELGRLGISGGSVYDALVAAAARQHGLTLLSHDARAQSVYEALGVAVEVVSPEVGNVCPQTLA